MTKFTSLWLFAGLDHILMYDDRQYDFRLWLFIKYAARRFLAFHNHNSWLFLAVSNLNSAPKMRGIADRFDGEFCLLKTRHLDQPVEIISCLVDANIGLFYIATLSTDCDQVFFWEGSSAWFNFTNKKYSRRSIECPLCSIFRALKFCSIGHKVAIAAVVWEIFFLISNFKWNNNL